MELQFEKLAKQILGEASPEAQDAIAAQNRSIENQKSYQPSGSGHGGPSAAQQFRSRNNDEGYGRGGAKGEQVFFKDDPQKVKQRMLEKFGGFCRKWGCEFRNNSVSVNGMHGVKLKNLLLACGIKGLEGPTTW